MGRRRRMILGGIAAGAAASLAANALEARDRFEARIDREIDDLLAAGNAPASGPVTEADLERLPEPVRRWLHGAHVVGRPIPTSVRLRQEGELLLGGAWRSFTAEAYYTTDPPGFVWRMTMPMGPGLAVVGRDRYADGEGSIEMRLGGVVPVARDSGPEMDRGALLRYLNEIMWFPAAALSPCIAWEPVDGASARATMTWGGVSGSATFFVDPDGRVTDMVAERYDRDAGAVLPWSTPITDHGTFGGVRVPTAGEAVYARPSGDAPYIRLRVVDLAYDRPERYGAPQPAPIPISQARSASGSTASAE